MLLKSITNTEAIRHNVICMSRQEKKRKTKKRATKKKGKAPTENREKQDKLTKLLGLLKPTPNMLVGAIIGAVISLLFLAYINPWILPLLAPRAELDIKVFQSHAPYTNGTSVWGGSLGFTLCRI